MFIKKLYLQATVNDAFVVHAGSYTSPWAPFVESLYGYRFIEKTQTDRLGYANTADWGLNATGKLGGGLFTYSVSIVNGGGFKNPSRSKYVDYEGRVGVTPVSWLTFGAGFYSGHLGQINTSNQDFPKNTASRWDLALGVHAGGFRIGGEYFEAKNYKSANPTTGVYNVSAITSNSTTAPLSDKGDGFSVWSSFDFNAQWSVFGRYDEAKPSKDVVSELKDTYFTRGRGPQTPQGRRSGPGLQEREGRKRPDVGLRGRCQRLLHHRGHRHDHQRPDHRGQVRRGRPVRAVHLLSPPLST